MSSFWGNDLQILIQSPYIYEIFPTNEMSYNEKINAISRAVILVSCIGFLLTFSFSYITTGLITLVCIYFYYKYQKEGFSTGLLLRQHAKANIEGILDINGRNASNYKQEDFDEPINVPLKTFIKEEYSPTTELNPLGNVMLTDYIDNPNRKPAPPSFNPVVIDDINNKSKEITKDLYPGLNTKPLYSGLGNNMEFDDLMMQFYSTPSTTIPNDQGSFADYLYGYMPSCKDGDGIKCVKDNYRYI